MNIIFIGPSGAGKGTQAEKVAAKFNLVHIASGDLFRENLEAQTELGLQAQKYMDQGELVPDEVTEAIITERLEALDSQPGFILDGYPRTKYQAQALHETLTRLERKPDVVIYLKVSDKEIIRRIPGRLTCKKCQKPYHKIHNPPQKPFTCDRCGGELYRRNDDTVERAQARLKVFHRQTAPVIDYYEARGKLAIINGERTIEEVYQDMVAAIEAAARHEVRQATQEETTQIKLLKRITPALSQAQIKHRSLDIGLLGGPGSGKGTQAEQLCRHLSLVHIATGNLFRENLKNETELGKLAKTYMDRGELVPDDVTEAMVRERLSRPDAQQGFILDGFPRNLSQAEALTEMLTDMGRRLDAMLYIQVPDEVILQRLSGRMICRECQIPFHKIHKPFKTCPYDKCQGEYLYQRDDDNPETIRTRLETYHGQTAPLIDYYTKAGILIKIDGEGDVAEITTRMLVAVENIVTA
jgi:adenylate kinase